MKSCNKKYKNKLCQNQGYIQESNLRFDVYRADLETFLCTDVVEAIKLETIITIQELEEKDDLS